MKNRVRYFSSNDMCYCMNLDKIVFLQKPAFEEIDINDAIEFYVIHRYFKEGARSKYWSDEEYKTYFEKSNQLNSLSNHFFSQLNDNNIISHFSNIELGYHSNFWELFDICKLFNKIKDDTLCSLLKCKYSSLYDILLSNDIVKKYGGILRNYILSSFNNISVLLDIYEQDYTDSNIKRYLPAELTKEDICDYFDRYIDSEKPNSNYLSKIIYIHDKEKFKISDEIKLKAKRRYDACIKDIINNGTYFSHEIQVYLIAEQENEVEYKTEGTVCSLSYSLKWLESTLDYPSILNNFIYIFNYVDMSMRSLHPCKISQNSVIEKIIQEKSKRMYPVNIAFRTIQNIANMQMMAYYMYLKKQNIQLEDVLHWCFTEYLQTEFNCPEIRAVFPSSNSSFAEKCTTIIATFESITKQYNIYVKNKEIDFDLLSISSNPLLIGDIKSQIKDKYVYGCGQCNIILSLLFSDQCIYSYVERIHKEGRNYQSFYDLLQNEEVYLSDYPKIEKSSFELLEKYKLISIDNDAIKLLDNKRLLLLKELFENEVICKRHHSKEYQNSIDSLVDEGILCEKSSLFSNPEINYLNYLLNRSEYDNGLDIRNKYSHGNQQVSQTENIHEQNYCIFLRVLILLAIKINDEFCLIENIKKEDASIEKEFN